MGDELDDAVFDQVKSLLKDASGPGVMTTGFALIDKITPYIGTFMIVGGFVLMGGRLFLMATELYAWWKKRNGK